MGQVQVDPFVLYSSDLDSINSYDIGNGNYESGKIDHLRMDFH